MILYQKIDLSRFKNVTNDLKKDGIANIRKSCYYRMKI